MKRLLRQKHIVLLFSVLTAAILLSTAFSVWRSYCQAISTTKSTLSDMVLNQKRMIESLLDEGKTEGEILTTLQRVKLHHLSIGRTGEFVIGKKEGDSIRFLLITKYDTNNLLLPVKAKGTTPMHLAINQQTGFILANDYMDNPVYGAFTYIPKLQWGLVAKITQAEIDRPYIINAIISFFLALLLVGGCIYLFYYIANPVIKEIYNSEEYFKCLFEKNHVNILLIDPSNGQIMNANEAAVKYYGYSYSQLVSKNISDINMLSPSEIKREMQEVINDNRRQFLFKHRKANGQIRDVEVYVGTIPILGKPCLYSIIFDITDQKQFEIDLAQKQFELQQQNAEIGTLNEEYRATNDELTRAKEAIEDGFMNFKLLFDNMTSGFALFEVIHLNGHASDCIFVMVNPAYERIAKIDASETVGKSLKEVFPKMDLKLMDRYIEVGVNGEPFQGEYYSKEIDSHFRIYAYRPRPYYFALLLEDITEAEQSKENRSRMADILEASLNEIYVFDATTLKFQYVNYGALVNLGYTTEQMENMTPLDLKPDFTAESFNHHLQPLREGSTKKLVFETLHRRADSTLYPVEVHLQLMPYQKKQIFLALVQDITHRKKAELELIAAKEKAEESDHLKTSFLQNMSHEIRTPMNAILGFSELMPNYFDDKEKLESFAKIIAQRGNDLLEIINEILDIAKIESGQLTLHNEDVHLPTLFEELSDMFIQTKTRLDKQHLEIRFHQPCAPHDSVIFTDGVKLKQIFINLISNAIKFTHEGQIDVGCQTTPQGEIVFYVSDTGIGISPDKLDSVFDRFVQVNPSSTRLYGGTGLGLSITKGLVQFMNGRIWAESEPEKGSTFNFTVAFKRQVQLQENTPKSGQSKNRRGVFDGQTILIVEDDLFNAEMLNEMLNRPDLNLLLATNGVETMDYIHSKHVDLILMDIRLPDTTGDELTKLIKAIKPNIKIIAQTAYASIADQQRFMEAGCDDYISKPIKSATLLDKIEKHLKS